MVHLTILIDDKLKKKFKGVAVDRGVTMTEMVTDFIKAVVKKGRK